MPILLKRLDAVDTILPPADLGVRSLRTKDGLPQGDPHSTCLLREEIAHLYTKTNMSVSLTWQG